jgi:SAM-dependent methyltransferase
LISRPSGRLFYGREAMTCAAAAWHALYMGMDETLSAQIEYYRRRAPEYDETSIECLESAGRHYASLVKRLGPKGDVLELACGTGLWTQHLAAWAVSLTALDSSPEMVDFARARVREPAAKFVIADLFAWQPEQRFDTIFFGFWLSHVPPQRFRAFWQLLDRCLAPQGRVLFIDEGPPRAAQEHPDRCLALKGGEVTVDDGPINPEPESSPVPVVKRRLRDGTIHEIVKVFYDPDDLVRDLRAMGWSADVELTTDGLLAGTVRRG